MQTPLQNARSWRSVIRAADALFSPRIVENALKSVDLSRSVIDGPSIFIPYALQAAFAESVARQTGERHVGPLITARYGYAGLDLYGKYVLGAPRLDMAFIRGIRALRFVHTGSMASLRDVGEIVVLQFESGINSVVGARHVNEGTILLLIDLVRNFVAPRWLPEWIEVPAAFSKDSSLEATFGVPIRWGAVLPGIAIQKELLQALNLHPRKANSATVFDDLKELIDARPPQKITDIVHGILVLLAAGGELSEDAVAARLGLGTRTLQRRLSSEGSSFRQVLASFQAERASALLLETDHSVQEIASALGYLEVNSFRRAFRKWTGKTPTEFAAAKPVGLLA